MSPPSPPPAGATREPRVRGAQAPTRRQCLRGLARGVAVTLALPSLESLAKAARPAIQAPAPRRLAFVYVPNGVRIERWRGTDGGAPLALEMLARHNESLSLLFGLTHDKARANGDGPGDHARAAATFLTGCQALKSAEGQLGLGISADQLAARALRGDTRLASLQLGNERGRSSGLCDSGYPCAYQSNLSWRSERTPMPHETDPARVFDRLFGSALGHLSPEQRAARLRWKQSILDHVRADARQLAGRLSRSDVHKLDEYQTGVRELELQLARLASEQAQTKAGETLEAPAAEQDLDYAQRVRLQYELLFRAFELDATRVATYLVANAGSNRPHRELDVSEGHHSLSHHGGDANKLAQIERIDRFHLEELGRFLDRLSATREADGRSLLEHSAILYGSGIADGNRHDHHDLPLLLIGRLGGTLPPGTVRRFPQGTPLANLHLSLLERFGTPAPRLGDSTGLLELG